VAAQVNVRVGVSTCLLGESVRFDANHKRDNFVADALAEHVELISVCPEVESGMPIPRPAIQLRRFAPGGEVRLVDSKDKTIDHSDSMREFSVRRIEALNELELCGYVFKAKSPSCGVYRVPVYEPDRQPEREGRGLFAAALMEAMPQLPVEEEGRLRDAGLRENFVERVFAFARLRQAFSPGWRLGDLVRFHSREKLLLLAHKQSIYRSLGRVVAGARDRDRALLESEYKQLFLEAMSVHATRGTHVNVMQHILGYFKEHLDSADRRHLLTVIEDYQAELVPLVVPITLLRFFVRRYEIDYLEAQSYLSPHPKELMLRNRA